MTQPRRIVANIPWPLIHERQTNILAPLKSHRNCLRSAVMRGFHAGVFSSLVAGTAHGVLSLTNPLLPSRRFSEQLFSPVLGACSTGGRPTV